MQETDFSLGSAFGLNNSLITPRKNRPQKTEGEEIVSEMHLIRQLEQMHFDDKPKTARNSRIWVELSREKESTVTNLPQASDTLLGI